MAKPPIKYLITIILLAVFLTPAGFSLFTKAAMKENWISWQKMKTDKEQENKEVNTGSECKDYYSLFNRSTLVLVQPVSDSQKYFLKDISYELCPVISIVTPPPDLF